MNRVARRSLAGTFILLSLALAACGGGDDSGTGTTATTVVAPTITTQPTASSATVGSAASFSVVATGTSLTYQWYKAGVAVSGATAATFSIASVATTDAATYYVIVTDSAGSVTSSSLALTVTAASTAPSITTQPVSQTVAVGATATFTVVATGTSLTYQWYKDSTAVSGATAASYSIASVASTDAGTYYVTVTNTTSAVTSTSATLTVSTTASGSNTAAVVTATNAFLATLTTTQLATAQLTFTLALAEQWSNLPGATRNGPTLGGGPVALSTDLTTVQQTAALALAQVALSTVGYTTMAEIRAADNVIRSTDIQQSWNYGNYHIAVLGTPSTTSVWMLQISGHHLTYNITYNGTYVSATPMFIGVEPPNWTVLADGTTAVVTGTVSGTTEYSVSTPGSASQTAALTTTNPGTSASGAVQHAPLETQRAAVSALATAIQADTTLATSAKLTGTFDDVVMGVGSNGNDTNFPFTGTVAYPTGTSGRGVLYSSLSTAEQAEVKTMIEAWVNTQASDVAASLLTTYESDTALASTYVAYAPGVGGTADFSANANSETTPLNEQHSYIRIDGPRVWIEFVVQEAVAFASEDWVHYHSIWRDKTADYGGEFN